MTARADTNTEHAQAAPADPQDTLTPEQHHAAAQQLVRQYTLASMAVALVPLPVVDLAVLVAVQLKMLHGLAGLYGIAFKADVGRSAIASLIGGAVPTAVAPSLAASLGKFIPGAGHALVTGSLVVLNGAATYALGQVFIQHFAAGGTFLTFDPAVVRDYFEAQFQEGREMAAELKPRRAGHRRASGDGDAGQ